ncbi:multidrug effflux MFS transporter [Aquicoccus porphyridii]|uniref:Bcr/CflA family efflux transporter n=1 Tax=Aquicoccus porphyridii TaxID=1852029 RepID=A0A5A9ZTT2_9RHOB|nr:multidrug effflux MFS transporter [Aquicoccus porphyridii]KAA0920768.1 multidrug effflux MFS transporter [Aquicoccus porphyridii]RAI56683.1 Bcr/CflA family drug resistance efflux transporter [Rhodobacteraceae bacterium AsT-22]
MQAYPPARFLDKHSPPHLGTLIGLTGIAALAMNLFLPSLPGMAAHFGVTPGVMGLSVGLFLLVNAVLQLVVGPISDRFGRRRVIIGSLVAYCVASLGCIFAPNALVFLSFRMLQASIAVAMVLSRAVVRDITPGDKAGARIAYVTMGMAVVPMFGPAVGGLAEQYFGWQANFWILFVAGLVGLAVAWADLGETAQKSEITLIQQYREMPELLRSPRFWGYSMAATCSAGTFFSFLGGAPFVATDVFLLKPQELGIYFAAPALGYFFGNFAAGRYSARIGGDRMVLIGMVILLIAAGTSLMMSLLGLQTLVTFFALMVPVGFGNGMSIPNAVSGTLSVRPKLAGTASGLGGAMMLAGGAGLSALAGWALEGGQTATPLVLIQTLSSAGGVLAILYVIRRAARLGAAGLDGP